MDFKEVMLKEEPLDELEPNHESDQKCSKLEENQNVNLYIQTGIEIKNESPNEFAEDSENDEKVSELEESLTCIDTRKKILFDETTTGEQLERNFESEREKTDDISE
ncbi:hypothetical protein Anas_12210, partial [Armadillidium nasatum]